MSCSIYIEAIDVEERDDCTEYTYSILEPSDVDELADLVTSLENFAEKNGADIDDIEDLSDIVVVGSLDTETGMLDISIRFDDTPENTIHVSSRSLNNLSEDNVFNAIINELSDTL